MKKSEKFDPTSFESKYQAKWREERVYQSNLVSARSPFYNLMMFPYPSAEGLHVGNMYAFTGADIYGRFMRMRGKDVFEPIGLDGFGIHSENYAIKLGKHPKEQAKISEANFYRQLGSIGNGFAWENRLTTYDPSYYKWTQWIFVQMFKHGLAYRKKSPVNFCPNCKTVLSDEQVINGSCERCESPVEKKEMEQWFFRITSYAGKLLENTFRKDFNWPEKVKIGQRNWIGKKEGIIIDYPVVDERGNVIARKNDEGEYRTVPSEAIPLESSASIRDRHASEGTGRYLPSLAMTTISCFTTRPDTNYGATFVVVAPEHSFVPDIITRNVRVPEKISSKIAQYVNNSQKITPEERIAAGREKTGVFTGLYCINKLNNELMPIYISDFVLMEFGTGAVVGVPGHDKRDYEFARKFGLDIKVVVIPDKNSEFRIQNSELEFKIENDWIIGAYEGEGNVINSDFLDGLETAEAIEQVSDYLEKKGWGKRVTTYRLRDWCISRQRYWGAPIPMIYCKTCAQQGVGWLSINKDKHQVSSIEYLVSSIEKKNNKNIQNTKYKIPDTDLMLGWYPVPEEQLPVLLPDLDDWKPEGTGKGPLAKLPSFVNTKCPYCGSKAERETDVCDTFLDSSWYFLRYPSRLPTSLRSYKKENLPWDREITRRWFPVDMYIGGAEHTVLHLLYSRFVTMAFKDFGLLDFDEPYKQFYAHGLIIKDGAKMSKSHGNVIIPDDYIGKYGSDTLRTYLMFLGPFNQGGDFRDTGVAGMWKFLGRVWRLVLESLSHRLPKSPRPLREKTEKTNSLHRIMHKTIKGVTDDLAGLRYNTAIAKIMEFVNSIAKSKKQKANITGEIIETLLLLLAPFAPHMTEELWQQFRIQNSRLRPTYAKASAGRQGFGGQAKLKSEKEKFETIHLQAWPSYDEKMIVEDMVTVVVQVNGKVRETLKMENARLPDGQGKWKMENEVKKLALQSEKVKKFIEGKKVKKTVFVPGRVINFVV